MLGTPAPSAGTYRRTHRRGEAGASHKLEWQLAFLVLDGVIGRVTGAGNRRGLRWDAQVREDSSNRFALREHGKHAQPAVALRAL